MPPPPANPYLQSYAPPPPPPVPSYSPPVQSYSPPVQSYAPAPVRAPQAIDPFGATSLQPTTTAGVDLELLARESSVPRGGKGWLWVTLFAVAAVGGGAAVSAARGGHPIAQVKALIDSARNATQGGKLDLGKLEFGDKSSNLAGGDNPVTQAAAQGAANGSTAAGASNTALEHSGPSGIDPSSLPLVGGGSVPSGGGATVAARAPSSTHTAAATPAAVAIAAPPPRSEPVRAAPAAPPPREEKVERVAKAAPVEEAPPPPPRAPDPPPRPKTGLQAAIEQAVVGKGGAPPPPAPVAESPAPVTRAPAPSPDMGDVPDAPGTGAVTSALAARMSAARACVDGQDGVSHANVTFGPSGSVINVAVSGPAAGTPAEKCIRDALWKATVGPFRRTSYSAKVNIRP